MDYKKFIQIISKGETQFVDFKINSSVFNVKNRIYDKAELVKDICAFSNNGNHSCYIIYGISDDGKKFKSVENDKLVEDNVQTLCTNSIYPPPKIKVHHLNYSKGRADLINKHFVVIQIGPQARKAFRFSKDFINYKEGVCFKKNEVWIRRNATSDLATPEEIEHLVRGKNYIDSKSSSGSPIEFLKLPNSKQTSIAKNELSKIINEIGGVLFENNVIRIKINKQYFVLKLILIKETFEWQFLYNNHMRYNWLYEHGYLIISLKNILKKALPSRFDIQYKEAWGWFNVLEHYNSIYSHYNYQIPINSNEIPFFMFFLGGISNSNLLSKKITSLLDYIENSTETYDQLCSLKRNLNKNLSTWLRQGWYFFSDNTTYFGGRPAKSRLKKNEFYSTKYKRIIKKDFDSTLISNAKRILYLSK